MNIIHRSGLSADAFVGRQARAGGTRQGASHAGTSGANRFGPHDENGEPAFSLTDDSNVRVTGPLDVLRWLHVWHARQDANWDGVSSLRVVVHGGALDALVVEARRGRQGITVSLLCTQLAMYRRLQAHRGQFSRALTSRLKLPVTVEVEARYVP